MRLPISAWRLSRPTIECSGEGTDFGKAEQERNLTQVHFAVPDIIAGQLFADVVQQGFKRRSFFLELCRCKVRTFMYSALATDA